MTPRTPAPLPWTLTNLAYSGHLVGMCDVGDNAKAKVKAAATHPDISRESAKSRLDKARREASTRSLNNTEWLTQSPAQIAKRQKANAEVERMAKILEAHDTIHRSAWDAGNAARVQFALEHYPEWIASGSIQLYAYQRGQTMMSYSGHENVVLNAVIRGEKVPQEVLDLYPNVFEEAARLTSHRATAALERERLEAESPGRYNGMAAPAWTAISGGLLVRQVGYGNLFVIPATPGIETDPEAPAWRAKHMDGGQIELANNVTREQAMQAAERFFPGLTPSREIVPDKLPASHPLALANQPQEEPEAERPAAPRG